MSWIYRVLFLAQFQKTLLVRMGYQTHHSLDPQEFKWCSSEISLQTLLNPCMAEWILIKDGHGPQAGMEGDKICRGRFMKLFFMAQGYVFMRDRSIVPWIGAQVSSSALSPCLLSSYAPILEMTLLSHQKIQPKALQMSGTSGTQINGYCLKKRRAQTSLVCSREMAVLTFFQRRPQT